MWGPHPPNRLPLLMKDFRGRALRICLQHQALRSVCPRQVPASERPYQGRLLDFGDVPYRVLDISSSAPIPGRSSRNVPPRFIHLVVKAGNLSRAYAFPWPDEGEAAGAPDVGPGSRVPVFLGRFRWGSHPGELVLALRYPPEGSMAITSCSVGRLMVRNTPCPSMPGRPSEMCRRRCAPSLSRRRPRRDAVDGEETQRQLGAARDGGDHLMAKAR
jgi:hypothetical protein